MRIEICGGIASGKTSLAKILVREGCIGVLEQFRKNPFYRAFYEDPIKYAFEAELAFLLQHYHQIKILSPKTRLACTDFSFVLDRAYAHVTLKKNDLPIFLAISKRIERELPSRTLLVHLKCEPEMELERIRRRARSSESTITAQYLRSLNASLRKRIRSLPRREQIVEIDSNTDDFVHNLAVRRKVVAFVYQALRTTKL